MRFWLFLPLVLFLNIILSSCSTDTVTRITDDLKDVKIQNNSEIGLLGSDNQFVDEPRKTRQDSLPRFTVKREESVNNNTKKIQRIGLCVITEIILRYYNDNSHIQNKIWFYDIEKTIYNNLVNLKN